MTKVFPKATGSGSGSSRLLIPCSSSSSTDAKESSTPTVLTVWKKSMLLNCDGFTVFNVTGNLVYRVDNYIAGNKLPYILLMNASGHPLFTIRRKLRLSLSDSWLVYEGETTVNPRYYARKHVNLTKSKRLVQVGSVRSLPSPRSGNNNNNKNNNANTNSSSSSSSSSSVYTIEGSYGKRCCAVYDESSRKIVAEIKRKEAVGGITFGTDVFRLVVHPEIDVALAMALVILLDQMFGSSSS